MKAGVTFADSRGIKIEECVSVETWDLNHENPVVIQGEVVRNNLFNSFGKKGMES